MHIYMKNTGRLRETIQLAIAPPFVFISQEQSFDWEQRDDTLSELPANTGILNDHTTNQHLICTSS